CAKPFLHASAIPCGRSVQPALLAMIRDAGEKGYVSESEMRLFESAVKLVRYTYQRPDHPFSIDARRAGLLTNSGFIEVLQKLVRYLNTTRMDFWEKIEAHLAITPATPRRRTKCPDRIAAPSFEEVY